MCITNRPRFLLQGDQAALLGQSGETQFLSMRFVDKAHPAESIYALIPPPAGAFERAGSPWQNIAPAMDQASAARQGFEVRATYDEAFLYIRPAPRRRSRPWAGP
jgi:hypothetical protein